MINQVSLERIKPQWDRAYEKSSLPIPFLTWQWHENWQKVLGSTLTPFYLSIDNEVIAPFVRDGGRVMFSGGEEIADYLDIIGSNDKKESAWKQILEFLRGQHISSLTLRNVPQNSPTVRFFQQMPGAAVTKEDTTPYISLPDKWETYVESLPYRQRHELERKIRKFEREHTDFKFIISDNPGRDVNELLLLMEKDEKKKNFLTPDMKTFFITAAVTFAENISLLLIRFNTQPVSATMAFTGGDTYYLYNSGFDRQCCTNAGFYLKAMSIKYAIEHGYEEYNFLQGNERYKFDLGGRDFFVYQITYNI